MDLSRYFCKENNISSQQVYEKMFNITYVKEMQIKNTMR